ncbi:RHS repeat-associated protein [Luteibacter sp. 621]|uniref:RHS repeat-associated core domain-containing protein n=1 Tax=Luteibacter sp. 621 TaxID=3373916 RepID=UPI003D22EE3F
MTSSNKSVQGTSYRTRAVGMRQQQWRGNFWRRLFTVGLSVLVAICGMANAETITYYYTNQQGTPLATADAAGNILSTADYRPYGAQTLGTPEPGPGYTGHVNDPGTGLVYMQARYYDPVVGRFLGADPLDSSEGRPGSFGRYEYASNNPILNIDPDGRDTCPGQDASKCVRSDFGRAKDLTSTTQMDQAAIDNRAAVETSTKPEKAQVFVGRDDVTVKAIAGVVVQTMGKDGLNLSHLPDGASAVEHSHIDGKLVGVSSHGLESPGDAQPLGHGIINYAVSERRVVKYEVVEGRIQITALKGSITKPEITALTQSINLQQTALDQQRPGN